MLTVQEISLLFQFTNMSWDIYKLMCNCAVRFVVMLAWVSLFTRKQRKWQGGRIHWFSWTCLLMVILLRGWFLRYHWVLSKLHGKIQLCFCKMNFFPLFLLDYWFFFLAQLFFDVAPKTAENFRALCTGNLNWLDILYRFPFIFLCIYRFVDMDNFHSLSNF